MTFSTLASTRFLARRLVLWALVVALPVYGCAGTLLQVLGPVHRHADAVSPLRAADDGLAWLIAQWKLWQARAHQKTNAGGHAHSQAHPHEHAHGQAHAHAHQGFERHHHARNGDVVVIGAPDGAAAEGDLTASASGSATLPLAVAIVLAFCLPGGVLRGWPAGGSGLWRSAERRRHERPPRPHAFAR